MDRVVLGAILLAATQLTLVAVAQQTVAQQTSGKQTSPQATTGKAGGNAAPEKPGKSSAPASDGNKQAASENAAPNHKPEVRLSERAKAIMEHTSWVFPMFKTAEAQAKTITQIDHFPYTEQLYTPSYTIESHPESQDSFSSPEKAM